MHALCGEEVGGENAEVRLLFRGGVIPTRTRREGEAFNVAALPLYKNTADARLEKTSPSAGVFERAPYESFPLPALFC